MELYCWQSFSFIVHINYLLNFQVFYCTLWNLNAEIQLITLNTVMTRISCIRCSHWVIYLLDVLLLDLLYRGLSTSDEALYKQTNKLLMMNHSMSFKAFAGHKCCISVLITIFGYKHEMMCEISYFSDIKMARKKYLVASSERYFFLPIAKKNDYFQFFG